MPDFLLVFCKTLGVGVTRVAPVPKESLAEFRHAPEEPAIFQLGVFLKMDSVYEHG